MSVRIDPRAVVSPKAQLGEDVSVGPFSIIEEGVVIGDGTTVGANVLLGKGARLGRNCQVHHGAVVGHAPQDLKYAGEPTVCVLGDRNIVREYAVLHRGTSESGRTTIGDENLFMAYSHVAHDCVVGSHVIMANAATLGGHVRVGDYAIIGGLTPVHQFVRIGAHTMIGGGFRVVKDVPPFVLAGNTPLLFEGLNNVGLRRRGFSREVLEALDAAYARIYRSRLNVSQALASIREDRALIAVPEVHHVVEFIAASKRGIISAPRLRS